MTVSLSTFKTLVPWKVGVLLAVLWAIAVALFGCSTLSRGSNQPGESTSRELLTVRSGTLVKQIAVAGRLVFPRRETLTFETAGTVGEVLAKKGQHVEEGQPLVRLDAMTVASLERAVAGRRVNLQNAKEALDLLIQTNSLDVARSEAATAEARSSLDDAQEALDTLLRPKALDKAQAEADVAVAKVSLDDAQQALDTLLKPEALDRARAEAAVANAKVAVNDAQEAYDDIKHGFPIEDIDDARNRVDFAQTDLANAQRSLTLARIARGNRLAGAEDVFDDALEDYTEVHLKWLGIELTDAELESDPDGLMEEWGIDLDVVFDRSSPSNVRRIPSDDPDTRWNELTVWAWMNIHPRASSIIGTCADDESILGKICVQREFDDTFDVYEDEKDNLETAQNESEKAVASAEDAITRAEEELTDAKTDLDELIDGPELAEIESAEKQLALAEVSLEEAEDDLDELVNSIDPLEVERRSKQVAVAKASLREAQEDLDELIRNIDPLEVERRLKQVELARANLERAEARVANLGESLPLKIALGNSEIAVAEEALEQSLEDLVGATLLAPFAGIISLVDVEGDDEVTDRSRVLEIVDPRAVEVEGVVDAADIEFVRREAKATVAIDALAGRILDGTVSSVASEPRTERGVVSYPVTVRVEVPGGVEIPVRLTGVSTVVIHEEKGVLLVPRNAINGTPARPAVRVMNNESVEERAVELGNSNGFWTVVREGLVEGEQVVMGTRQPGSNRRGLEERPGGGEP